MNSNPRNVLNGVRDPLPKDDEKLGFVPGSFWINLTEQTAFMCVNGKEGNAKWIGVGGSVPVVMNDGTVLVDRPYDDNKVRAQLAGLQKAFETLSVAPVYDDTELRVRLKKIQTDMEQVKPFDPTTINVAISQLRDKTTELLNHFTKIQVGQDNLSIASAEEVSSFKTQMSAVQLDVAAFRNRIDEVEKFCSSILEEKKRVLQNMVLPLNKTVTGVDYVPLLNFPYMGSKKSMKLLSVIVTLRQNTAVPNVLPYNINVVDNLNHVGLQTVTKITDLSCEVSIPDHLLPANQSMIHVAMLGEDAATVYEVESITLNFSY